MELVNNHIMSPEAEPFFGDWYPLGSETFTATLRYIALKDHQGGMETIQPIRVYETRYEEDGDNVDYIQIAERENIELLLIAGSYRSQEIPTIKADGWVSLDTPPFPVAAFLTKLAATNVYINKEQGRAIVCASNTSSRWCEAFASCLFRVLPWRFESGLTPADKDLFTSLNLRDEVKFTNTVNTVCDKYDFRDSYLRKNLTGWDVAYKKSRISAISESIESYDRQIAELQAKIANCLKDIGDLNIQLEGLQATYNEGTDVVYRFFAKHKNLNICSITQDCYGNELTYSVLETMDQYDPEEFLRTYKNKGSKIGSAKDGVKEVLYAIFAENRGVFRVESMFRLRGLSSVSPMKNNRQSKYDNTHLVQPHLYYYGCLGANEQYITTFLRRGDWDMAIEQSIAATKNLNFTDNAVIGKFVSDVTDYFYHDAECKCVIADNGEAMTVKEFYNYIKKEA